MRVTSLAYRVPRAIARLRGGPLAPTGLTPPLLATRQAGMVREIYLDGPRVQIEWAWCHTETSYRRGCELGTTWGPHAVRPARQAACRRTDRSPTSTGLTSDDS
jgi:hypothetical protein